MRTIMLLFLLCTIASKSQIVPVNQDNNNSKLELSTKEKAISKKKLNTIFTQESVSIDGVLDEPIWQQTGVATNFISFEPENGTPIPESKKTEVKIVYDNTGIYIGAYLYDNEPGKILKEFANRDNFGTADIFGIYINGYNDGQQDFRFFVSASNGQSDCQASDSTDEDFSWDAIWDSKAAITDKGWVVEMKIPYAALRFSPAKEQIWGINFYREVRRDRQKYTWTFIDKTFGTMTQQAGLLEGIQNIKTPTRLFLLPYASYYINANKENKTQGLIKGGLDIKYGINDAFTLDAVLIPDFGQTKVDQKTLNLGPFEQQFTENRPFFTEGTDLFTKGNLFYSRRIGGKPTGTPDLEPDEEIIESPTTTALLNAIKVSGRTKNGLGIGVLNAITQKTYATILNNKTGVERKALIEPLANYNILVFDQRFRKNSSVSFINTNVTRDGNFRDANVSGLVWDLNTKENTYNLQGNSKVSVVNENFEKKYGYNGIIEFNKTSGKYRYGIGSELMTKNFDNNDLGIKFQTNYYTAYVYGGYQLINSNDYFNKFKLQSVFYNQYHIETNKPQESVFNIKLDATSKNNNDYGIYINSNPIKTYDFYEPMEEGRVFIEPQRIGASAYYSSNYNNKFAYDINTEIIWANQTARNFFSIYLSPRYRFSDKLSLIYSFEFNRRLNNRGRVKNIDTDNLPDTPNDIIIARRDVYTYKNTLTGKYSINSKMNFNLSLFHYWSYSQNKDFLLLEQNGDVTHYNGSVPNLNKDFSNWNIDFSYTWWFAPGSQVTILYRNYSENLTSDIDKNYLHNFSNLINNNLLLHTLSVNVRYFIDYNRVKNLF